MSGLGVRESRRASALLRKRVRRERQRRYVHVAVRKKTPGGEQWRNLKVRTASSGSCRTKRRSSKDAVKRSSHSKRIVARRPALWTKLPMVDSFGDSATARSRIERSESAHVSGRLQTSNGSILQRLPAGLKTRSHGDAGSAPYLPRTMTGKETRYG